MQLQAPLPEQVYLEHYAPAPSVRNLFLGIGRFPDGQVRPVSAPLSRLVNIAIGGGSGFGKSVLMKALAYQVINARENVRPVFLDAQGVTFTEWAGDDRLLYPLGHKPDDILAILLALIVEMERRETLFSQWRGGYTLPIRLTPTERDELTRMADEAGQTMSQYVRSRIF